MDTNYLRLAFLILAILTLLVYRMRFGAPPVNVPHVVLDFLLVPLAFLTIASFVFLITRQDPLPYIRQGAYFLGLQHLVSFEDAIPLNLEDNLSVSMIQRVDTDGDDFREWVVFYRFDTRDSRSPIKAVVYDNDRGDPPVIFPYSLRAPDRNYLSEDGNLTSIDLEPVTMDQNGPDGSDLPEVMIASPFELTIFRFNNNSDPWDFPRDAPPRYEAIGSFRGSGSVTFDTLTKYVTVNDRNGLERSQLAIRSIYELNPATNTYWDQFHGETDLNVSLRAPIYSTVDFFPTPPDDILDTAYPEKIVLAFYAATCAQNEDDFCPKFNLDWQVTDFLATETPNNEVFNEYQNGNAGYFGLPSFGTQRVAITHLRYYPGLETDPDLLVTGGGRDVVTGEEAQLNVVDIMFVANGGPVQTARYQMGRVDGRWKMIRRLPLDTTALAPEGPALGPVQ